MEDESERGYRNTALIQAREGAGLSQERLANLAGCSLTSIWNYENVRSFPEQEMACKIARVLRVNVGEMFPPYLEVLADRKYDSEGRMPAGFSGDTAEYALKVRSAVESPEVALEASLLRDEITLAFAWLPERQREVLGRRLGMKPPMFDTFVYTLEECKEVLGVSTTRVSQIYYKALEELRKICGPRLEAFLGEFRDSAYAPRPEELHWSEEFEGVL